ncbi:MAG: hypothetical protein DSY55_02255 [Clostridia bacterium]|nr:MAG: hypothetical protein DSY55_02255 [Clostridia bacterium]
MDAITLAAMRRQMAETLARGRVQAVVQPDASSLALEIFGEGQRRWAFFSIDARVPRALLLAEKARRGLETDTPFLLLARKRLRGARLTRVEQPAWERVLLFSFSHPRHGESALAAEIMGRWSNLVLIDARGDVLASLRHFEHSARSQRVILPRHPYALPPLQRHKSPLALVGEADLGHFLAISGAGTPVWRILVQHLAGLSPLAAREIVFRATGDALADVAHPNVRVSALLAVLDWFRALPEQGGWAPTVAISPESNEPVAFAPYELSHLEPVHYYDNISAAARAYYAATLGADSYAGRRRQALALIAQARKKALGRRLSLGEQAVSEEDVASLRTAGEWVLAYAWQVQPGDETLVVDTGEGERSIPLDPALSASENAQAYFARYRKAKRAAAKIPALLAEVDRDLAYLDQLETDVTLADNTPQIEELKEALFATGLASAPAKKKARMARSHPLRLRSRAFEVVIGRNALQNEQVTWKVARPDDVWLHVQDAPGSHVIIRTAGREAPEDVVVQVAAWAAYYSKLRDETKAAVIVTTRRQLRKIKGGRPGQVRVLSHRSVIVSPEKPAVP